MKTVDYADVTSEQWAALRDCWWGSPGEERYSHDDPDEAIGDLIDELHPTQPEIEIAAFRPVKLAIADVRFALSLRETLEYLDAEYGDPEGKRWEPTPAVRAAWAAFVEAVHADFTPWHCEAVFCVRVDPVAWAREHRPELMTNQPGKLEGSPEEAGP